MQPGHDEQAIRRSGDWLVARAGHEIMMMSASRGVYLGLNRVGARIWDLIEPPQSREAVCRQLLQEFEVGEAACRAEVDAFLAELNKHQAIEFVACTAE